MDTQSENSPRFRIIFLKNNNQYSEYSFFDSDIFSSVASAQESAAKFIVTKFEEQSEVWTAEIVEIKSVLHRVGWASEQEQKSHGNQQEEGSTKR